MGVNSLPKTVTQQRRGCDLNPGPSAPESSTLTTRLPSHSMRPDNSKSGCWHQKADLEEVKPTPAAKMHMNDNDDINLFSDSL